MINDNLKGLAVPIDQLHSLPGNPRVGDVAAVARSLERFGQRKPIVARHADGVIIAGNHTWQAAKKLGWTEIAVVWTDDDDDTMKAFALADNRTSELGSYDEEALRAMVEAVATADPELIAAAGYNREDLAKILGTPLDEIPLVKDPDEVPAIPQVAHSVGNDVWLLGPHRLVVGDSTDPDVLAKALNNQLADCVVTDPPYNVAYEGGIKTKGKDYRSKTRQNHEIENDDMGAEEFAAFLLAAYSAMFKSTREGGAIYVFHSDIYGSAFRDKLVESGWFFKQVLIWVKDIFVLSRQDYNWQHEPILYGWKPGAAHSWYGPFNDSTVLDFSKDISQLSKNELLQLINLSRDASTVIREPRPRRNAEHPTMKPVNLITRVLSNSATRGNLVLDPFGGSGSTLMAAHSLGMTAALVELDPIYADVICRRWQEATGVLPVNEVTGKTYDFTKSDADAKPA